MNYLAGRAHAHPHITRLLLISSLLLWAGCASLNLGGNDQDGLFPRIEGWKQSSAVQVFLPETLYDYINGAAIGFQAYDFQDLHVAEYTRNPQASVLVEIYRHSSPNNAFGIYSQERPRTGSYLDIGAQGYVEEPLLNFISGDYYVKLNGTGNPSADRATLETFARVMVNNLAGETALPPVLACFPAELQLSNSEMFIARNFLGYEFLHSGYIADYRLYDQSFKLFIIEGSDRQDCWQMLESYAEFARYSAPIEEGQIHAFTDRYQGDIALSWKGNYIWGALNLTDSELLSRHLEFMGANLDDLPQAE